MDDFESIDISKYTAFFHDGSLFDIFHSGSTIILSMGSAQMSEEDLEDDISLSKDDCIVGKLHIQGVKRIAIDEELFLGILKKEYDNGEVLDFDIIQNRVELGIAWVNYPPKPDVNEFTAIEIEAERIWWENIPDLKDPG